MSLSGAGTLCQIGLRKKFELKLSNNSIFGGLKCNCQFGYILCLFLDYFNKFLCIISVPNLNGGNVPKFHVRNVPNFEVGNVPNLKLGNCIQSIITPPGILLRQYIQTTLLPEVQYLQIIVTFIIQILIYNHHFWNISLYSTLRLLT